MSQQPFSRPGAIDLSSLKRPASGGAPAGGAGAGGAAGAAGGRGGAGGGASSAYVVQVDQQNFQATIEASMTAPVLLAFYSRSRMPESGRMADDLAGLAGSYEGRFLVGLVDIDAAPEIAQAMQIPQVPLVVAVLDGRPAPLLQDVVGAEQLKAMLDQLTQQLTAQGMAGRHQPRHAEPAEGEGDDEPAGDPRYAPAEDALAAGDYDRAVAEYQRLVTANPADTEAAGGLAMATVLQRTAGVDPAQVVAAADAAPDDVEAQTLAADVELLEGRVTEAFTRLVETVRRTAGDERTTAREHLLGLFAAVGNDDPRVLDGRRALASALF